MRPIKLPTQADNPEPKKRKEKKSFKKTLLVIVIAALMLAGGFLYYLFQPHDSPIRFIFNAGPGFQVTEDRVNVLLLGNAGGSHDGANLTDTVIVASLNIKTNKVYLISLPRDMWVEDMKAKI